MKNVLLLFAIPFFSLSQTLTVNVWDVRPDSICPGDSITVLYKITPVNQTPSNTLAVLYVGGITTWTGSWSYLKTMPKEKWPTAPDSVWKITVVTPTNLPIGNQQVRFNNGDPVTIAVKDCSCTISSSFTFTSDGLVMTYSSTAVGTNSTTQYWWLFGTGQPWMQGTAVQSYTYVVPMTYTVGLQVLNPTCNDTYTMAVTVNSLTPVDTTGIEEYQLSKLPPIYYDLMGQRTEKRPGVLLIEQRGTLRRKIMIQ